MYQNLIYNQFKIYIFRLLKWRLEEFSEFENVDFFHYWMIFISELLWLSPSFISDKQIYYYKDERRQGRHRPARQRVRGWPHILNCLNLMYSVSGDRAHGRDGDGHPGGQSGRPPLLRLWGPCKLLEPIL